MKKIILVLLVFGLLILTGCGSKEQSTNDLTKDESQNDIPLNQVQSSFTVELCSLKTSTGSPVFNCESSVINKDKITIKLRQELSGYKSIERIYFPKIGINGCELNIVPSFENAMKYDDTRVFEIPCNIESEIVDTNLIVEYVGYEPTTNINKFDIKNEQGKFVIFNGKIEGALSGNVR